jgi:hypothetical protein
MSDVESAFDRLFDEAWQPFGEETYGSGHFGGWLNDGNGEPAYEYKADQRTDPRARYYVTGGHSTDHWHVLGNDRIAATAHNGGYVQVYDWSRGGKILNRWDPERGHYAGGFKFLEIDGQILTTLWDRLPKDAQQRRVFGVGYFEKHTSFRDVAILERIEAPCGDDPVLLSTTAIENRRVTPLDLSVVEFWGVNLHQLTTAPIMTHGLGKLFEWRRRRHNRLFRMCSEWDPSCAALSVSFTHTRRFRVPKPGQPSMLDWYPKTVFLAALDNWGQLPFISPSQINGNCPQLSADGDTFFGNTGLDSPPGVRGEADGLLFDHRSAYRGRAVLAMRRCIHLAPGEGATLRYLFGYAEKECIPELAAKYHAPAPQAKRARLELAVPGAAWLGRELAWHSYYLQANTFYQDFYGAHFVDQGSAYGYLQGLSGAPRDFFLFVLPMVYLRPNLAKEMLRFSMRSQDPDTGAFSYAHIGHGKLSGFVVHNKSSDLDLFFLWALAEYLAATQDLKFLNEAVSFYPPSSAKTGTVLEHARASFRHLTQLVGLGPHGLLRCGTGDWNDLLITYSRMYPFTIRRGESSLNAGLASLALPAFAEAIKSVAPEFSASLREFADKQSRALRSLWAGRWLIRGYLGYFGAILGKDRIFLDTQAFPVIAGLWDEAQRAALFDAIHSVCVKPQFVGALSMWPPMKGPLLDSGSDTNGGTWAAIDSWIAWAWSKHDPRHAWDFFLSTTLAAHAEAYPDVWYGIWSGPDSYNAHYHARPGETFNITFTPMTDFPVMNANRHSGPLLDAIKFAGIEPRGDRIVIDPRMPFDSFAIRLPLIGAAYLPGRCRGYYAPVVAGTFRFAIRPPADVNPSSAMLEVNGEPFTFTIDDRGRICFEAQCSTPEKITWEMHST